MDDGLSEAHERSRDLSWQYEWDWAAAEQEFQTRSRWTELRLPPGLSRDYLAWRGRRAEALTEITRDAS